MSIVPLAEPDWPCWLNPAQSAEARALVGDMGFRYVGNANWHPDDYDLLMFQSGDWQFYTDAGFDFIDCFCNGAIFRAFFYWEDHPNMMPSQVDYDAKVREIKACLRRVRRRHKAEMQKKADKEFFQLRLF